MTQEELSKRLYEDYPDKTSLIDGIMNDRDKINQVRWAYKEGLNKEQIAIVISVAKYGGDVMYNIRISLENANNSIDNV